MSTLKDFRFQVDAKRNSEQVARLTSSDKPPLDVGVPPEFRGGLGGRWSPEDLLVGASASCYAVTLSAIAAHREIPVHELTVTGAGHVTRRADGRFGFVLIELYVVLTTDERFEDEARSAVHRAEARCLVSNALAIPVEVELELRTVPSVRPALAPA